MSLVELGWRRFKFFDQILVKDPDNLEQPFVGLQELDSVGWSAAGEHGVLIAERSGGVALLGRHYDLQYWNAYKTRCHHIHYVAALQVAVTVGDDDEGVNAQIKVWALERKDASNTPFCLRQTRTQPPNNRAVRASRITADESGTYLFVGFDDSTVLMYRGHITKDKAAKPIVIRDGQEAQCANDGAVTGVFCHTVRDRRLVLFVCTAQSVTSYVVADKNVLQKTVHNARGCPSLCCALADHALEYQLIVAKRDLVHLYNPEQCAEPAAEAEGGCQGFEADKQKLMCCLLDSYLLLVTKDTLNPVGEGEQSMNMITIYDLVGKYIAYNAPVQQVQLVFAHWGAFFVVTKSGRLFRLNDQHISTKLDVLFRKNLYDVAIGLAKRHLCNQADLIGIFKQHADYLYEKGDYENAVAQYVHTIGTLEHSYVIRKFLDAQRIAQLTVYLEALHERGSASGEHTTMLLNCYTKLQNEQKLAAFADNAKLQWKYDVNTAIRVLRKAGYQSQAARLAERHDRHDQVVGILVDEQQEYTRAIDYIARMDDFQAALGHVKTYGKLLMNKQPDATEHLLNKLVDDAERLAHEQQQQEEEGEDVLPPLQHVEAVMRQFVKLFVDDPLRLRSFLQHHLSQSASYLSPSVCVTLLELNLIDHAQQPSDDKQKTIMQFLHKYADSLDKSQSLVLCQTYSFTPGTVWLYEQAQLYNQAMKIFMDEENFDGVLNCCEKYGAKDANMWIDALWFVCRSEKVSNEQVRRLVGRIESSKLLPPILVLDILANCQHVTLAVVKDYLLNWLSREQSSIQTSADQIQQHRSQIDTIADKINDLQTKAQVFQVSKCRACDHPLEVPTVHFLCGHSYHKHCFESYAESDAECPACAPEYKKIRTQLDAQNQRRNDAFKNLQKELRTSEDIVATVADQFGRGLFVDTGNQKDAPSTYNKPPAAAATAAKPGRPVESASATASVPQRQPAAKPVVALAKPQPVVDTSNPFDDPDDYPNDMNPFGD